MAQSVIALYNLAISLTGSRRTIASTTDRVVEAEVANLWYEVARRSVLRSAHWNSAKAIRRLALVKERNTAVDWDRTDPDPGWKYAYAQPADLLHPRHLADFSNFGLGTIFQSDLKNRTRCVFTNTEESIFYYTFDQTDVGAWEPDLYEAVAYTLAASIAPGITGKQNLTAGLIGEAMRKVMVAREAAANDGQQRIDYVPDELLIRGYSPAMNTTSFIYPYGLLTVGEGAPVA